jgi:hypothetical protein
MPKPEKLVPEHGSQPEAKVEAGTGRGCFLFFLLEKLANCQCREGRKADFYFCF